MTPMKLSVRIDGRTVIVRHGATGEDIAPFESSSQRWHDGRVGSGPTRVMAQLAQISGVAWRGQRMQNTSNARRL